MQVEACGACDEQALSWAEASACAIPLESQFVTIALRFTIRGAPAEEAAIAIATAFVGAQDNIHLRYIYSFGGRSLRSYAISGTSLPEAASRATSIEVAVCLEYSLPFFW